MEVHNDTPLLVLNLENCTGEVSNSHKGEYFYTLSMSTDCQENEMIEIPVTVECTEQDIPLTIVQYGNHDSYMGNENNETTFIPANQQVHTLDSETVVVNQDLQQRHETNSQTVDFNTKYYTEIFNYLMSQTFPEGVSQSYNRLLVKRAQNYKVINGKLHYGHKQPKEVIIDRDKRKELLKKFHIEDNTGIHLCSRKMYAAMSLFVFWKGLYMDVNNYVRKCNGCVEEVDYMYTDCKNELPSRVENKEIKDSSSTCPESNVWQQVELQILGRYPKTDNQKEYLIVIVEPVSSWVCAEAVTGHHLSDDVANFIFKTFCTFGFTKCYFSNVLPGLFKDCVEKFLILMDSIKNAFKHLAKSVKLSKPSELLIRKEGVDQKAHINAAFHELVTENPTTWDEKLYGCLFKFHATSKNVKDSSFYLMFHRSPIMWDSNNKENIPDANNFSNLPKRRSLYSSILKCRHCGDTFTSRVSFLIHQRKHTEEARSRGLLEGEDVVEALRKEIRIIKRTTRLKSRSFYKGRLRRSLFKPKSQSVVPVESQSSVNRDELQAGAVAAVREMLVSSKAQRKLRGKYRKYSQELQEEIAKYALSHGKLETARYFSKKLGSVVNESTIRNIVKLHCFFTPEVKSEIGKYASQHGIDEASRYFTQLHKRNIRRGLVCKFLKFYHSQYSKATQNINSDKKCNENKISNEDKRRKKNSYDISLKEQIGNYACHASIADTIKHFQETQRIFLKDSMVRKLRRMYSNRSQISIKNEELHNPLQNITYATSIASKSNEVVAHLNAQNINFNNHSSITLNNGYQHASSADNVISVLPHYQTHELFSSTAQGSTPTFLNVTLPKYTQSVPYTSSVIVNQSSSVNSSNSSSTPISTASSSALQSTLSDIQHSHLYSSLNHAGQTTQNTVIPLLSNNISQSNTQTSQEHNLQNLTSHMIPSQISHTSNVTSSFAAVPTIRVIMPPLQHSQAALQSENSSVISSQNNSEVRLSQINSLPLFSQTSLILPQQQGNSVLSQQLFQSQSSKAVPHESSLEQFVHNKQGIVASSEQNIPMIHNQSLVLQQVSSFQPQDLDSSFTLNTSVCLPAPSLNSSVPVVLGDNNCNPQNSENNILHKTDSIYNSLQNNLRQNMDDIIISFVQPSESQKLNTENDSVAQLSSVLCKCSDQLQKQPDENHTFNHGEELNQQSNVIHYAGVNDSVLEEETFDDPDPLDDNSQSELSLNVSNLQSNLNISSLHSNLDVSSPQLSKTKKMPRVNKKGQRSRKRKKAAKKNAQKRGSYMTFSPELRAEMGKYAAEYGSVKACNHFKSILGHDISESTIRGLRDRYLMKLYHNDSAASGQANVTELGYAQRGRPMRLGKYDEIVRECILDLAKSGENISSFLVIAMAKQVLLQYEPNLLEENGGHIKLNSTWAKSFLRRVGLQSSS